MPEGLPQVEVVVPAKPWWRSRTLWFNALAAVLTVTDNGPGVPAAEREVIFRRLYRGDASRSQRGLGLGLDLVAQL